MTYEFEYLMQTLGSAAVGAELPEPVLPLDMGTFMTFAQKQSVMAMAAYAIGAAKLTSVPGDYRKKMSDKAFMMAAQEFSRQLAVLSLLSDLEKQGIKALIIKGFSLSGCYAVPELRISGDVDIYVGKKEEKRALDFFAAGGSRIKKRLEGDHHSKCWNDAVGLIEIHSLLYNEYIEDIWFNRISEKELITEPFEVISTENGHYYTLGKTDHMIFLALHLIKHFIISGINLRNILDIVLFYSKHYAVIDLDRFWGIIRRLDFEVLINTVMGAAIRYCGLPEEWYGYLTVQPSPENMETILNDMETASYFDSDDKKNRETGWYAYSREKSAQSHGKLWYRLYMIKMVARQALFIPLEELKQKYPVIDKLPVLIPFVWLHRLIVRGVGRVIRRDVVSGIIEESVPIHAAGQKRLEMFRKLDMI